MAIDKLNDELKDGFLAQMEASTRGEVVYIPNPIKKLRPVFNLMQSRFTLIGANSGVGKSSFVDDLFVMKAWDQVKDTPEIHWEVLYYSMERKKMFKYAKMMSWMLYRDYGWKLDADTLLGWGVKPISGKVKEAVNEKAKELSELLDRVDVYDGRVSVATMSKQIINIARRLGVLYKADSVGVKVNDSKAYSATFSASQFDETRHGKVLYLMINHKGKKYKIRQGKHIYIPHKQHTFMYVVLDGIGLIDTAGYKSTKEAIDAVVNLLADARDLYGFSPVVVSQFNRGIADIHRVKHHGASNGPQESDFKDSSNQFQAADLVLALFDPVRAKAYDKKGMYGGYNVTKGLKSGYGHYRYRGLKVLKNSFGIDNAQVGFKFLGEVNYFEALPDVSDVDAVNEEYLKVHSGD